MSEMLTWPVGSRDTTEFPKITSSLSVIILQTLSLRMGNRGMILGLSVPHPDSGHIERCMNVSA